MWCSGLTPRAPEAEARSCCPRGLIKHSRKLQNKTGRPLDRAGQGEAVFASFSVTYLGVLGQAVWLQVARFLLIGASKLLQGLKRTLVRQESAFPNYIQGRCSVPSCSVTFGQEGHVARRDCSRQQWWQRTKVCLGFGLPDSALQILALF